MFEPLWFEHTKKTLIAISKCQTLPKMSEEDIDFIKKVSFMESITESILQLCLSCLILRAYGLSSQISAMVSQLLSLTSSLLGVVFAFGSVSTKENESKPYLVIYVSTFLFICRDKKNSSKTMNTWRGITARKLFRRYFVSFTLIYQ